MRTSLVQPATAPHAFSIVPAAELVARGLAHLDSSEPPAPNPDRIPAYGEIRTHSLGHKDTVDPVYRLVLTDAVVHGAEGVVTTGRYALAESLVRVRPERAGAVRDGAVWMVLDAYVGETLPNAEHLLCGDPGNYCHWLLDGLARSCLGAAGERQVLVPAPGPAFQRDATALLQRSAPRAGTLAAHQTVQVGRLTWTSSLTGMGSAFHPALRRFGAAARQAAPLGRPAAIYVSRRDTARRVLSNESAIEQLCAARGFVTVVPSALSVTEQAAVFAGARRIVVPHGAALANLVFCRPGAAVLELLMDNHVNFYFRQLAGCMGLNYGCVLGRAGPGDPKWVHATSWRLDPERVARAMNDPSFNSTF